MGDDKSKGKENEEGSTKKGRKGIRRTEMGNFRVLRLPLTFMPPNLSS